MHDSRADIPDRGWLAGVDVVTTLAATVMVVAFILFTVSMPDAAMGEKSCAFIVSRDPALRGIALRKFLRSLGLADYKLPDRFERLDALPMTAVGKVDKNRLRHHIAEQLTVTE